MQTNTVSLSMLEIPRTLTHHAAIGLGKIITASAVDLEI